MLIGASSDRLPIDIVSQQGDVIETYHRAMKNRFATKSMLCLPLYSRRGLDKEKFVAEKSGLNQWNAAGRARDANEIYIPYQAVDRHRDLSFFPPRDTSFILHLPDGTEISAKVCQTIYKTMVCLGTGKFL